MQTVEVSKKSRLIAFLFCFFLGVLGAHRFYVRRPDTAILMILTIGGLGIWCLVDLIMIGCGIFRDREGKVLKNWFEELGNG